MPCHAMLYHAVSALASFPLQPPVLRVQGEGPWVHPIPPARAVGFTPRASRMQPPITKPGEGANGVGLMKDGQRERMVPSPASLNHPPPALCDIPFPSGTTLHPREPHGPAVPCQPHHPSCPHLPIFSHQPSGSSTCKSQPPLTSASIFCPHAVPIVPDPQHEDSGARAAPGHLPTAREGGKEPRLNSGWGFSITQLNAQLGIITSAQKVRLFIIGM